MAKIASIYYKKIRPGESYKNLPVVGDVERLVGNEETPVGNTETQNIASLRSNIDHSQIL